MSQILNLFQSIVDTDTNEYNATNASESKTAEDNGNSNQHTHHKTLIITFIGAPNAGKSTIVNGLIGEKISAISAKPHTTRLYLRGVLTEGNTQLVFVDTPGFMHQKAQMDTDADLVCLVLDAKNPWQYNMKERIKTLINQLDEGSFHIIINKSDTVRQDELLFIIQELVELGYKNMALVLAAIQRKGLPQLKDFLIKVALPYPWLFDKDTKHEMSTEDIIVETIREKIFHLTYHELPYTTKIELVSLSQEGQGKSKRWVARAIIRTSKQSQKSILIGRGAQTIRSIGEAARVELSSRFGHGNLFLEVM